jgi:hypothetical protein
MLLTLNLQSQLEAQLLSSLCHHKRLVELAEGIKADTLPSRERRGIRDAHLVRNDLTHILRFFAV